MQREQPPWGPGWMWPIPDIITSGGERYPAQQSQEFRDTGTTHYGIDLMYRDGRGWVVPEGIPVQAALAGTVWSVDKTARGWGVVIDHGKPWATFYQHLDTVAPGLAKGVKVARGQPLGTIGSDPMDPSKVRHLHFAVWYNGSGDKASVDPGAQLSQWDRSTFTIPAGSLR